MKMSTVRGEVLLAACDRSVLGKTLRDGKIHLTVDRSFYLGAFVNEKMYIESLSICSIANLVGNTVVGIAEREGYVSPDNTLVISGIRYAQFATMEVG